MYNDREYSTSRLARLATNLLPLDVLSDCKRETVEPHIKTRFDREIHFSHALSSSRYSLSSR
jgi:hypothetical protein